MTPGYWQSTAREAKADLRSSVQPYLDEAQTDHVEAKRGVFSPLPEQEEVDGEDDDEDMDDEIDCKEQAQSDMIVCFLCNPAASFDQQPAARRRVGGRQRTCLVCAG